MGISSNYLHSGQHRADFKTVYILLWVCDAILKQPRSILRRLVGADHPSDGQIKEVLLHVIPSLVIFQVL